MLSIFNYIWFIAFRAYLQKRWAQGDTLDFRDGLVGESKEAVFCVETITLFWWEWVQWAYETRRFTTRTTCSLPCLLLADGNNKQTIITSDALLNSNLIVETAREQTYFHKSSIHNVANTIQSDWRFGNVGRQDDLWDEKQRKNMLFAGCLEEVRRQSVAVREEVVNTMGIPTDYQQTKEIQ